MRRDSSTPFGRRPRPFSSSSARSRASLPPFDSSSARDHGLLPPSPIAPHSPLSREAALRYPAADLALPLSEGGAAQRRPPFKPWSGWRHSKGRTLAEAKGEARGPGVRREKLEQSGLFGRASRGIARRAIW